MTLAFGEIDESEDENDREDELLPPASWRN